MSKKEKTEIIIDEKLLKDKIYIIRGVQVMIDSDLAEIYGYTTKAFNQQVKNNIENLMKILCSNYLMMKSRNFQSQKILP